MTQTVSIIGVGLMGSSLGLALRKRGVPVQVHAFARREETCRRALELGVADAASSDLADAVRAADLIVFCVPVLTIPELAVACLPALKPGAVLTDVGSTKACLTERMAALLAGTDAEFVGSHPICGSEQQGIEEGIADLYENSVTIVTPSETSTNAAVEKVSNLWKNAGSDVAVMDAAEHDRILAFTSHLPHIAAAALVLSETGSGRFCGSGFHDTTRIAEGSPQVWSDIVRTNAPALKEAIGEYRKHLDKMTALIDENDGQKLADWFAAARDKRRELLG